MPLAAGDPERRRARAKIAIFLALVAAFAGILDLLRVLVPFGTTLSILTWTPRFADALAMWSVALAGFIALVVIDRSLRDFGLKAGAPKYMFFALVLPVAYGAAVYVPVWVFQLGWFAGAPMLWAATLSAVLRLPLHLFVAAGEELGWRGVLVPNLARIADARYVAFLPGTIWALWHYPDILFFDYNVGTPFPFALTCFSISLIGQGAFLSWLRLASGSIWPAVVFHGIHNSVILGIFDRVTERGALTVYITTEFGVGFSIVSALVGYLFWSKLRSSGAENPKPPCSSQSHLETARRF
jgi:membrane protease YdiL (CAAX protease family)